MQSGTRLCLLRRPLLCSGLARFLRISSEVFSCALGRSREPSGTSLQCPARLAGPTQERTRRFEEIPMTSVLLLLAVAAEPAPVNWPELVQKPYAELKTPDLGLKPLLTGPDGKAITTRAEWEKARAALREAWLKRLGPSPEKPADLDVRIDKTEPMDGYTRTLLSFRSEGDDRIPAYLLTPDGLAKGEKRPAIVVFHQTTRDTLLEP